MEFKLKSGVFVFRATYIIIHSALFKSNQKSQKKRKEYLQMRTQKLATISAMMTIKIILAIIFISAVLESSSTSQHSSSRFAKYTLLTLSFFLYVIMIKNYFFCALCYPK